MGRAKSLRSNRVVGLAAFIMALSLFSPVSTWARHSQLTTRNSPLSITNPRPLKAVVRDSLGYVPNQMLVKLSDASSSISTQGGRVVASASDLSNMISCFGFSTAREIAPGTYKLSAPQGTTLDVNAAADALKATGAVSYAGPNHMYYATNSPNDEQYVAGQQWGVTQIKAEQAWDITTGSDSIVITILDTGTANDHPDLDGKVIDGYDFINNDNNPYDDHGHGTYTAGIAAAVSNNGTGVVGISWGAKIMPVKVLSSEGSGSEAGIAEGIRWAVDHGTRIISASLGGDSPDPIMGDAVQYAHDHNVLFVASSGNNPDGNPNYPAGYDTVLAVGATGRSDTFTGFSSYGRYVDVTAPGVGILSTGWDGGDLTYEYGNGTSASCPFVSGVAALVWSVNPQLTADQVKQIIEDSSDDLGDPGWDEHYGDGRLNAFRAVQFAQQGPRPTRTPTSVSVPTNTPAPTATKGVIQPPSLQVNTTNVTPGALLSVTGAGFGANELVDLTITGADNKSNGIGNAQADAQGVFRAELALPKNLQTGKATLSAAGSQSGRRASVELTVAGGSSGGGNGGQSAIRGTLKAGTGNNLAAAAVHLKTLQGPITPEIITQPDAAGTFSFSGLSAGLYAVSADMPGFLPGGPYSVQLNGGPSDVKTVLIILSDKKPAAMERVAPAPNTRDRLFFQPVGHTLKGSFLKFWQSHGGLAIFGYPISEEFQEVSLTDGKTYTVQYFERNRFEYHPEFANTPSEVLMGLLGVDSTRGRTFLPGTPVNADATHTYFPQTQHNLSGAFLKYWKSHGGLSIFGYPISEELSENGYTVQYFQRNRFEYHPEFANTPNEVLLGLLGVETAKRNGWITP